MKSNTTPALRAADKLKKAFKKKAAARLRLDAAVIAHEKASMEVGRAAREYEETIGR